MKGLLYIDSEGDFKIKYVKDDVVETTVIHNDEYYKWHDVYTSGSDLEVPIEFDLIEEEYFDQKVIYGKIK